MTPTVPKQRANPQANMTASIVRLQGCLADWQKFRREVHQRSRPTSGRGDGRGTEVSDPTGNAVAHIAAWEEYEMETAGLTSEILGLVHDLEKRMHGLLHVDLTKDEQSKMRCNGKHDATCTELASVGPTGRPDRGGACIAGYWQERRATQEANA